jgi:hypothetical protein
MIQNNEVFNNEEIDSILHFIKMLKNDNVDDDDIGVITFCNFFYFFNIKDGSQNYKIQNKLKNLNLKIKVSTVDAFQGFFLNK